jgi:hypothetical protein
MSLETIRILIFEVPVAVLGKSLLECIAVQIGKVLSRYHRSLLPPSSKLKMEKKTLLENG